MYIIYRASSSWSYTEFSLSLSLPAIAYDLVSSCGLLICLLRFLSPQHGAALHSSLFSGFSLVHTLQGLGTQHSRRACVIGVKCHGKELISSIIIIYGSLCVHLPQNTKHKIQNTKHKYGFSSNLFSPSLPLSVSLFFFFALFFVCVLHQNLSFNWGLGCKNAKNIASHFELLLFVVVVGSL